MPEDLTELVGRGALVHTVYDSLDHVDWPKSRVVPEQITPNPVLRTLLIYAYATGVYSVRDIEAGVVHDPTMKYLAANFRPRWETLREFRRQNSHRLQIALSIVIARLMERARACGPESYLLHSSSRFSSLPIWDPEQEAGRRLRQAVRSDSMSLDD